MADAPAEPGTPPPEAQSSIDDRTTSYYMAVSPGQAAAASPGRAGGGATDGADGAPPPSATAAGPPPKLAVHAMTAEDASETAPDVDSGFTSERYFLPAPGDRLVEELTAAELHELRKDSRAVRNRYMHISKVIAEAKINEEYIFPNGNKRVVRTIDVVAAAHEQGRLLRTENQPIGMSFDGLSISVERPVNNKIDTTGSALRNMAMSVIRMLSPAEHGEEVTIVEGVSGSISPGETVLVIGAAGTGCSSLMKVLAGRYNPKNVTVTGDLSYNDTNCSQDGQVFMPPNEIAAKVGFCYEGDNHIPELTVEESLGFISALSFPNHAGPKGSAAQKIYSEARKKLPMVIVQQIMRDMGIHHVAKTVVGNDLIRGVSGGQKKRVTVGEVSCKRPSLAFYDGYTKGLDSATALGLAQTLTAICWNMQGGVTVIASQYQASQEIFEVFDKVLVLQKEDDPKLPAQMVYFGPTDKESLEGFFSSVGCKKPDEYTWPDYLGTMKGGRHVTDTGPREDGQPNSAADLAAKFREHQLGQKLAEDIKSQAHQELNPKISEAVGKVHRASVITAKTKSTDHFDHLQISPEYKKESSRLIVASFKSQLKIAIGKEFQLLKARKSDAMAQIMITIMMGLIVGFLFFQLPEEFSRAFDRTGVILNVTLLSATAVFNVVPVLMGDRDVMYRQTRNHMYRGSVFFIAKSVAEIPVTLICSILASAIMPTLAGFQIDGDRWPCFFLNHFMLSLAAVNVVKGFVFLGSTIFNGYLMGFFALVTMMLMNGFMLPAAKLGWWFRWFTYVNPLQWSFAALTINEFDGLELSGFQGGTISGEVFRKEQLEIDYDNDFKWIVLGINLLLTFAGIAWGCWVCENVRHDDTEHKVKFHVPCDHEMKHRFMKLKRRLTSAVAPKDQVTVDLLPEREHHDAFFTFKNVSYTVDIPPSETCPDGKLKLLNNVNGFAKPGMMIALMGTSGAGKTTLLDVLAQRKTSGHIEGEILVNGVPQDETFSRLIGYVEQTDMHLARSTIFEAFMFAARLGRDPGESDAQLNAVVEDVIKLLELDSLESAMIGSPETTTGISLEALKRVTMGVELVTDPSILFMDEPTSGLDTAGALLVAKVARNIAKAGKTVICTIHQPSRMVLETFDYMLLLKRGGNTVYFGPIGPASKDMVGYFEAGGAPKFHPDANPAEVMLDVVAPSGGEPICDWAEDRWVGSQLQKALLESLDNNGAGIVPPGTPPIKFATTIAAGPVTQFRALMVRQSVAIWRNPGTTIGLLYAALYPAFLVSFMFIGLTGNDEENGANYTSTALYAASFITPAFFIFLCLPGVYEDRAAFYRETSSGLYSKSLFALSLQLASIPYLLLSGTINAVIVYHLIPLREGGFGYYWVMFMSFMFLAWQQGLAIGALTPSMAVGTAAVMAPLNISNFFAGFLVVREDIGWWFRWLYYFNPSGLTYVLQGLYKNEFEPRFPFTKSPGVQTGRELLAQYGWNDDEGDELTKWECVGIVWIFAFMWFCIGQYAMINIRHGSR